MLIITRGKFATNLQIMLSIQKIIIVFHIFINTEVNCHCFKSFFLFSFEFQVNVWSWDIIYENQNLSNATIYLILYDSDSSVSDGAIHLKMRMKSIQLFQLIRKLKCYLLLVDVPNLVEQLDITQNFFKIRACIFITSLFCPFTFTSNNQGIIVA